MTDMITEGYPKEYFENGIKITPARLKNIPLRKIPCDDCAVTCGMYFGISNDLKKCDLDTRIKYSKSWDCHQGSNTTCRGNWNNQNFSEEELRTDG